jgi:hypothetical protein
MLVDLDLDLIADLESAKKAIHALLNMIESMNSESVTLRATVQQLRDEVNRLKGEQGQPKFPPRKPPQAPDHSSEQERRQPREHKKGSKQQQIEVQREEIVRLDRTQLPEDARFKGYEAVVVQDLKIKPENVRFLKEKWYSAEARETYLAPLPAGYEGQFGPGIKSLILTLSFGANVSEAKIGEFLHTFGVSISAGQVSNLLIHDQETFHGEKDAIFVAGLSSTEWENIDDTATRVNGVAQHCHVLCNPYFSVYLTLPRKDRLTVLSVLQNGRPLLFRLNGEAYRLIRMPIYSPALLAALRHLPQEQDLSEEDFAQLLSLQLPDLAEQKLKEIYEAAAIASYHAQTVYPVVRTLVCDDAGQFKRVTEELSLCWVHEGRHYKKLNPCIALHRQALADFQKSFWDYYHELLAYTQHPTTAEAERMSTRFDEIFTQQTGYRYLDERIAITYSRKAELLVALSHPDVPLHNNSAELAARARVRKRDVSFGPRTEQGRQAWDTFMTIAGTARKLGVSFYHYIHDRLCGASHMPSLASLITQRSQAALPTVTAAVT